MSQFFTLLTKTGQGLLANAIAYGEPLTIAELAIGDGGGKLPTPDATVSRLVNEVRRGPINQTTTDPDNPNWIIAEQVLPPDVGGWTIREVGLYDTDGNLVAYGNYPETYKPQLSEGSSRTQTIRFVMEVTDTSAVTLRIDPSVVMASRKYVDDQRAEHENAKQAHDAGQITLAAALEKFGEAVTVQAVLAMLGTGALQNIGSAEGELLSVGDFGVGISPSQRPCHDIDALDLIGRYYARGDRDEYKGSHPFDVGYILDVTTKGTNNITQTARPDYTEGFAQRVYNNGWRAWEYFAGATGTLGNAGSGSITIPYYDGKARKNLIIQMFQRVVTGPGTNLNDVTSRYFNYPVAFPSRCHKLLVSTLDDPGSAVEGSEMSSAPESYGRASGTVKLVRVRGSNTSGNETLILDCLAIGE